MTRIVLQSAYTFLRLLKKKSCWFAQQQVTPNRPSEPLWFCLLVEQLSCFILEGIAGHVERIRQTKCSTSKRKTNRKQWKQPKIIDERHNERLGLKQSTNCTLQNNSLHLHMRINLTSPILGKVKPSKHRHQGMCQCRTYAALTMCLRTNSHAYCLRTHPRPRQTTIITPSNLTTF